MLEIDKVVCKLEAGQQELIHEIHMTPTGECRAVLCDANIHLTMALLNLRHIQLAYKTADAVVAQQVQA